MIVRVEAIICNSRNFMGFMTIGRSMPINTGSAIAEILTIRNPIICNSRNFMGSYDPSQMDRIRIPICNSRNFMGLMTF